jgi:FixJ family two-component response regulator
MWTVEARQPVAYVTMQDIGARAEIVDTLERAGWRVFQQPTGVHLLQAIADVIEGKCTWLDPTLIVIDAFARGCSGTTIAAGLRELGIKIPIVLITTPGHQVPITTDETLRIVDSRAAASAVAELANASHPPARDSPIAPVMVRYAESYA